MTKAMPLFSGTRDRKCSKASNPPAEAPMPTMGNPAVAGLAGGTVISGGATWAGLRRRISKDFFFMRFFPALPKSGGMDDATSPDRDANAPLSGLVDSTEISFP
jgi:hypothetical protein